MVFIITNNMRRKLGKFMVPFAAVTAVGVFYGQDVVFKKDHLRIDATRCAIYRRMKELSKQETMKEKMKRAKPPHLMTDEERRLWILAPVFPEDPEMREYYNYINGGFWNRIFNEPPHNALEKWEPNWLSKDTQKIITRLKN